MHIVRDVSIKLSNILLREVRSSIKAFCLLFLEKVGCQQVFHKVLLGVGKAVENVL